MTARRGRVQVSPRLAPVPSGSGEAPYGSQGRGEAQGNRLLSTGARGGGARSTSLVMRVCCKNGTGRDKGTPKPRVWHFEGTTGCETTLVYAESNRAKCSPIT